MSTNGIDLEFSHIGFACTDLPRMVDFYTRILGLTVTDSGHSDSLNLDIVFMSRNVDEHHQVVLTSGRPAKLPPNEHNKLFGAVINQISFRVNSLAELKALHKMVAAEKPEKLVVGNHGISWSMYFSDPEGNMIECFVDTDWYMTLPFMEPLDLSLADEEIRALTERLCRSRPGFDTRAGWQKRLAAKLGAKA